MTANDIQELLDGALPDEASAELLHTLSISPEHRAAFQQHLALRDAFERDRAESVMEPDEDAMVWAGIVGGLPPAAAPIATGFGLWRMAGALGTVAALLVGAYILGSSNSAHRSEAVLNNRPLSLPALSATLDALRAGNHAVNSRMSEMQVPEKSTATGAVQIGTRNIAGAAPQTLWRDRVVYRDRIVYRDRVGSGNDGGAEGRRLAASRVTSRDAAVDPVVPVASSTYPNRSLSALLSFSTPTAPVAANVRGRSSGVLLDAHSTTLDPLVVPNAPTSSISDSPLLHDGFEVSYTERIGRLGALPQGTVTDPTYTTRSLGLGYRFADGTFGVGARIGNGTFPTVALEPTQRVRREGSQNRIDTLYVPTLESRSENTVEMFVNGRIALLDRLAIGLELAANKATRHTRIGADLSAVWFLTDRIGLQGGVGVGRYWYDLSGSREALLEHGENVGVSDDALDSYEGAVVEGRYGVLVRF